jgi:hypothetical protein
MTAVSLGWEHPPNAPQADIGTEDANRRPYTLQFHLKLRGPVLNGPASAVSDPGNHTGNALTQWVELRK